MVGAAFCKWCQWRYSWHKHQPKILCWSLANNGGSTLTHALLLVVLQSNAGNNTVRLPLTSRGTARIVGGAVDIGPTAPNQAVISLQELGLAYTDSATVIDGGTCH